ncbi:glycosyltransferase family 4 protein [Vagococcus lutrae]|uniref:glycosyltransferase family 4 protein n=1 Tax=Vagococcus lutrae TaxID=81947 RepID=UPI000F89768C|nr:glycosyltransferase family 4 protein [Vagococcus lutrae]RST93833.1 hypothetical protein CBF33_01035 [Vagococcus lutrae]
MSDRILFISNLFPSDKSPYFGTFVKNNYEGLKKSGYNIDSIVLTKEERTVKHYLNFYWEIIKYVNNRDYQFIYIHYISNSSLPFIFMKTMNPIILNVHGTDVNPTKVIQKILLFLIRPVIKKASLIVTPSSSYKELMINRYGITENNVFVSPSGGINRKIFKPNRDLVDKTNKDTNKEFVIGYVSRIEHFKGWKIFIKLVKELENEKIKFKIVGSGSEIKQMWEYIDELEISHKLIEYLPAMDQEELSQLFNEIDCLIFPSFKESLGLIGIEALACGCTVIGSDINGINSYVKHGENGYLFEKGNIEELKKYTLRYIKKAPEDRRKMIEKGIETSENYDMEMVTKELANRIRRIK